MPQKEGICFGLNGGNPQMPGQVNSHDVPEQMPANECFI
jgi:hypothetical protein